MRLHDDIQISKRDDWLGAMGVVGIIISGLILWFLLYLNLTERKPAGHSCPCSALTEKEAYVSQLMQYGFGLGVPVLGLVVSLGIFLHSRLRYEWGEEAITRCGVWGRTTLHWDEITELTEGNVLKDIRSRKFKLDLRAIDPNDAIFDMLQRKLSNRILGERLTVRLSDNTVTLDRTGITYQNGGTQTRMPYQAVRYVTVRSGAVRYTTVCYGSCEELDQFGEWDGGSSFNKKIETLTLSDGLAGRMTFHSGMKSYDRLSLLLKILLRSATWLKQE